MSMADNKTSRIWQVGRDQVGNAVLEWNPRTLRAERVEIYEGPEPNGLEGTYNLLKSLDCNLVLEDALALEGDIGHDPYNTAAHRAVKSSAQARNAKG
jgi:hypothetical protein